MSNVHKFPSTAGGEKMVAEPEFEKEKLFVVDPRIEQELRRRDEEEIAALVAASKQDPSTVKKQLAERDHGTKNRIRLVQASSLAKAKRQEA